MLIFRSILFVFVFYIVGIIVSVLYLPTLLLPRAMFAKVGRYWTVAMLGGLAFATGIRHQVRGRENVPDGPVIFTCKHQSAWETLAMNIVLNDPAFILKKEILWIPIFGWYQKKIGNIPVDRSAGSAALRDMIERAKKVIAENRPILIFPQGTRTPPNAPVKDAEGNKIYPYLPGVAGLYTNCNVPVVPMALNSGLFWQRKKFLKFPGVITVEFLPPIEAGLKRREFMTRLEAAIEPATKRLEAEALKEYPHPKRTIEAPSLIED
jgi:1-acyl-sn-glycerol-3-phosphate acyltransferase